MTDSAKAILASELDARARVEALDTTRSLLLQAPAGSGKTTVLTKRFLTLLTAVELPEEILAITFTRKAAAEMRHRILTALQAAGTDHTLPGIEPGLLRAVRQRDQQLGWDLLDNPARLRVETIDAMNSRLARALPVSARCGPTLEIARAPLTLYQRAARRTLESAWHEPDTYPAAELLFERLDNSWHRLQRLLAQMLERRSHWLPRVMQASGAGLAACVQQSIHSVVHAELAAVLARLPAALLEQGEQIMAHTEAVLGLWEQQGTRLTHEPSSLGRWRALCDLALTGEGWRRRFTIQHGFERGDQPMKQRAAQWIEQLAADPEAQALLRRVQALPDARLAAADEAALEALALLLLRAATQLQWVFAEAGKVDYAYVAGAARASLVEQGEPSEFALRTGNALRHILVDEFQDTSYEQFELLRALTVGWESGDGRTLFVVGDPMQSIYQFREAEVGLFLRARDYGVGELPVTALQLRRNFRARAALLAWVNEQFSRLFPAHDDACLAAIRYLPSVPAYADDDGAEAVTLHRFEAGDRAAEARRVLEIVLAARARDAAATIAILVASREHASLIVAALRHGGLSFRGVDLEPLGDRPAIRDLAVLTRALLHRADRGAWVALLRAPWCALTLAQLESLCARDQGDFFATALSATPLSDTRLPRLCAALAPALRGAERGLPLWQRVERCWLRLAGPAIYPHELDRLDVHRFLDALALHDDPQTLVGDALGELTHQLYSTEPPKPGAIEIMTMHAAKGLEWDVVILPGLGRKSAIDADPLLHWIELPRPEKGSDLLLSPIRATEQEPKHSLPAYIKRLRRERVRIERVRLLYVAATRARRALHLLGTLKPPTASATAPCAASGSLLELLWPVLGAQFAAVPLPSAVPAASASLLPGATRSTLWQLPAQWAPPPVPPPPRPARLRLASSTPALAPEYSWVGLAARAVGTIVHAELHRLALAGPLPEAGAMAWGASNYADWLAELGVEPHEQAIAQTRIALAIGRTLADPRGRWLLSSTHREAHSEWRLTGEYQGRVVNVIFDRMLLDEHGQRWVVDFKTSVHEGGAVAQFLDTEAERYRAQLLRYAALARELGPQPVHVALYFPLLSVFRELPLPPNAG